MYSPCRWYGGRWVTMGDTREYLEGFSFESDHGEEWYIGEPDEDIINGNPCNGPEGPETCSMYLKGEDRKWECIDKKCQWRVKK